MTANEAAKLVVDVMTSKGLTLSVAESFTGGAISSAIVSVAGASKVLLEGVVCYNENSKTNRLGVSSEIIAEFGVVSTPVAESMARGAMRGLNPDYALATTGNAGPTKEKNSREGEGYIALAMPNGEVVVKRIDLDSDRKTNIEKGTQAALTLLYENIKNL